MNHNKKRNVGIIYELLVRAVSAYLVENNKNKAQTALNILSKYFGKSTEIYKEFRLLNALAKSTVKDSAIAAAILNESKAASRRLDSNKINKEKSGLIREVNYSLVDSMFYHRNVPDYKAYATIQTLINHWREGDRSNLTETVLMESKLIEWIVTDKQAAVIEENIDPNIDSLVVKLMNEKFNSKYADKLTNDQKELINEYVFSIKNDNGVLIRGKALQIRNNSLAEIKALRKIEKNPVILEKIDVVERRINELDFSSMDDDKIARLMTLTQLMSEIREK